METTNGQKPHLRIIVDAYGGDNAPLEILRGAALAVAEYGHTILLTGNEADIRRVAAENAVPLDGMEIVDASDVITMDDEPKSILKEHKGCSMAVGLRLLAEGKGDAFVSAGSTGALIMGATFFVKRIKGVSRAALAPLVPSDKGPFMLIDSGANVECRPEMLLQFAHMGSIYMTKVMHNGRAARVGLLNVGTEDHKGGPLQQEANTLQMCIRDRYGAYLGPLLSVCPDCREIAAPLAGRLSDTQTPQGIFCICRRLDNRLPLGKIKRNGRYLLLEDVQDPGNLGTIVRTAEAFGIDGLFLTAGCCDLYNPKVLRGSMGGVLRLASARTEDPSGLLACLREKGLSAFACVADAGARPVQQTRLGEGCVCLIGNEGAGLRPETAALCDERITIPMKGRAESLNASIAAAIVLWEMTR